MNSNVPLSLELKPSRTGLIALLAFHGLVLLALLLSRPPLAVHALTVLAWAGSLAWVVHDYRRWPANGARGLTLRESGWQVWREGRLQPAELLAGTFVSVPVMVLPFRLLESGKTIRLVLWQDSATADDIRRLRVRLLHPEP